MFLNVFCKYIKVQVLELRRCRFEQNADGAPVWNSSDVIFMHDGGRQGPLNLSIISHWKFNVKSLYFTGNRSQLTTVKLGSVAVNKSERQLHVIYDEEAIMARPACHD